MSQQAAGVFERKGFDIDNFGDQARSIDRRLALLDVLGARRNQQYIDGLGIFLGRTQYFEVVTDFVHRKGNVLVGLGFDLALKICAPQIPGHLDDFGDSGIAADRYGNLFALGAGAFGGATNRLADGLGVDNCLFIHGVSGGWLGCVGFNAIAATRHGQLNELDRRGGYVESQQWSFAAKKKQNWPQFQYVTPLIGKIR